MGEGGLDKKSIIYASGLSHIECPIRRVIDFGF